MRHIFSSDYRDILIFILPSIGPESYIVNKDVGSFFKRDTYIRNNKIYLDLWGDIESSLIEEEIPENNIFNTKTCTLLNRNEFFSNRNRDFGRNLNFGYIKKIV